MRIGSSHIAFISSRPARLLTCAALAVAFTAAPALSPEAAYAVSSETQAELNETQQKVDEATKAYEEAQGNVESLQKLIDENQADIAEIESQLPGQRDRAAEAMRLQYKYQKNSKSLLGVVLGTTSFDDVISTLTYMDQIQESNNQEIERLTDMEAELAAKKAELEQAKTQAESEQKAASDALKEAQRLRTEAQEKAEREAAEELARLAAVTAAAEGEGVDGGNTANTANRIGQTASVAVTGGAVNWNVSREEFVAEWTSRIDAYLAGSPLAGYGSVFANAAWDNTVDPRWSPAIACIESTKGAHCFRSYNAWGWMTSQNFSSWDESIPLHVAFLGRVYGTTLTPGTAQKYCPPTWQDWYNTVAGQMNVI